MVASAARELGAAEWIDLRYPRGRRLGGGRSEVFLGHDRLGPAGPAVVVKEARGEPGSSLQAEVDLLLRSSHPAFRRVLATGRRLGAEAEGLVAVLEHVDGTPFDEFLAARPEQAWSCAVDVLRALVFLHSAGFVHGDLKPLNLLVTARGVRVIDLGLAVPVGAELRGVTPGFSPPEATPGTPATVGGDLYAFAATLRACGVPDDGALGDVLRACLAGDPRARPATAATLLGMLHRSVRPIDLTGEVPRLSDHALAAAVDQAVARDDGTVVVVEAAPGMGRTRLVDDGCRAALRSGRTLARVTLGEGHDPFGPLAGLLLAFDPEEPAAKAPLGIAAAARAGVALVADDADQASPAVREALATGAAALRELGRGSLVVVGADEALAAAMERAGAERLAPGRVGEGFAAEALAAAGAFSGRTAIDLVVEVGEGRPGTSVRVAEELAEKPEATPAELRRAARVAPADGEPAARPLPRGEVARAAALLLEAAAATQAIALLHASVPGLAQGTEHDPELLTVLARAEARRGNLGPAVELIARCAPLADPDLRLEAAGWFERQGKYEAAWDLIEPELEGAPRDRVVVLAARAACGLGRLERARELARRGLAQPDVAPATECRLRCVLSDAARMLGDAQAAAAEGSRAADAAGAQNDPTLRPQALARQAAAHALAGDQRRARELYLRALEEALSAGDVAGVPPYVLNLATAEHLLGDYGAALARYQEAARIAERLGRRVVEAAALVNWAGLLVDLGAVDEAGAILEKGAERAAMGDAPFYEAQARLVRAALLGSRSPREGHDEALRAADEFSRCNAGAQALEARLLASELAVAGGDVRAARRLLEVDGAALAEGALAGRAALLAARLALGAGNLQEALREAGRCERIAAAAGDPDLEGRALVVAAGIHAQLGTGAAEPLHARARETLGRVSAMLPPGLREKYLRSPDRLATARASTPPGEAAPATTGRHDAMRLWALVRRLLLEGSEARLLEAAVDEALGLTGAQRGLLLLRRDGRKPAVAVARNMAGEGTAAGDKAARFSRSVAERVLESGELVVTTNAFSDESLRGSESVLFLGLRSILCAPIRGPGGVAGALYLDHRLETARFGADQAELVQALADIIGVALENARLHRRSRENELALAQANEALRRENVQCGAEIDRLGHLLELHGGPAPREAPGGMIGGSRLLRHSLEMARRTAPSALPILIEGASGTGKELLARYVHEKSRRRGPFVAINCGALPATLLDSELFGHVRGAFTGADRDHPGLFRAAEGGTLLLDEIGEMPLEVQPRLLRVLQEGEIWPLGRDASVSVDVRVVAATNRDVEAQVRAGRFREDLFYRLAGVRLRIPSLAERRDDLPLLAEVFRERAAERYGRPGLPLSRAALRAILQHDWPGNVRELEQTVQRGVLLAEGSEITPQDLGLARSAAAVPGQAARSVRSFDVDAVRQTLRASSGNRMEAARQLGVSRSTLYRWLERYGID